MSITSDIFEAWYRPKQVMRRHMARGISEPFAFSLLVTYLVIEFIALWPQLSRQSLLNSEVAIVQRLVAAGLGLLATLPFWYVLASLSHWIYSFFYGRGSMYHSRLALFTALVSITPLNLLQGLVGGILGEGAVLIFVQGLVTAGFVWIWGSMLHEAERRILGQGDGV